MHLNWRQRRTDPNDNPETRDAMATRRSELAQWTRIQHNLRMMRLDRNPDVPRTFEKFLDHKRELAFVLQAEAESKRKGKEWDAARRAQGIPEIKLFHGRKIQDHAGTGVLGYFSIWMDDWTPTSQHPRGPWPPPDEFDEEGNQRHSSHFTRFFPVPRGNPQWGPNDELPASGWKGKSFIQSYTLDKVQPVPRIYPHIALPGDRLRREPEFDSNGVPIDDDEDHGNESEARPRGDVRDELHTGNAPLPEGEFRIIYTVDSFAGLPLPCG